MSEFDNFDDDGWYDWEEENGDGEFSPLAVLVIVVVVVAIILAFWLL